MSLTISLAPEEEKILLDRASAIGQDVAEYVHRLIRKDIEQQSFAELLEPIRRSVRESGVSESELDSLLQSAIDESRANRKF